MNNNKWIAGGVLALVIVAGGFGYLQKRTNDAAMHASETLTQQERMQDAPQRVTENAAIKETQGAMMESSTTITAHASASAMQVQDAMVKTNAMMQEGSGTMMVNQSNGQ